MWILKGGKSNDTKKGEKMRQGQRGDATVHSSFVQSSKELALVPGWSQEKVLAGKRQALGNLAGPIKGLKIKKKMDRQQCLFLRKKFLHNCHIK